MVINAVNYRNIGSLNLTEVDVRGVAAALDKHSGEANVESKGVKAHFALDDSGKNEQLTYYLFNTSSIT